MNPSSRTSAADDRFRGCAVCGEQGTSRVIKVTVVESDVEEGPSDFTSGLKHFASRKTWLGEVPLCLKHQRARARIRWGCPIAVVAGIVMGVCAMTAFARPPKLLLLLAIALFVLPIFIFSTHQQNMMNSAKRPRSMR